MYHRVTTVVDNFLRRLSEESREIPPSLSAIYHYFFFYFVSCTRQSDPWRRPVIPHGARKLGIGITRTYHVVDQIRIEEQRYDRPVPVRTQDSVCASFFSSTFFLFFLDIRILPAMPAPPRELLVFKADRPFHYAIKYSAVPLFAGFVVRPSASPRDSESLAN